MFCAMFSVVFDYESQTFLSEQNGKKSNENKNKIENVLINHFAERWLKYIATVVPLMAVFAGWILDSLEGKKCSSHSETK